MAAKRARIESSELLPAFSSMASNGSSLCGEGSSGSNCATASAQEGCPATDETVASVSGSSVASSATGSTSFLSRCANNISLTTSSDCVAWLLHSTITAALPTMPFSTVRRYSIESLLNCSCSRHTAYPFASSPRLISSAHAASSGANATKMPTIITLLLFASLILFHNRIPRPRIGPCQIRPQAIRLAARLQQRQHRINQLHQFIRATPGHLCP